MWHGVDFTKAGEPKKCQICTYWQHENESDGFVCACDKSDELGDWTDKDFVCEHWEYLG